MNCTLEPAIQSGDTSQHVPFLTAVNNIDHNMAVHKLNTVCICFGHIACDAWSLLENSQSEGTYYCSHLI